MQLPSSFNGYQPLAQAIKTRFRRLMIGTDGAAGTGKSEFALSCPGPGLGIVLDRGIDTLVNNPEPPSTRRNDFYFKIVSPPMVSAATQNEFIQYWKDIRDETYKALGVVEARTILLDGDSDSWEIQRMAEFGKIVQVPPHMYQGVNAARRAFYSRMWDSGKIVICTNKIKKEYETVLDVQGNPVMKDGKEKREWTGQYERQGFPDQEYLFQIQLTHLFRPAALNPILKVEIPQQFGIRINRCKANRKLEGTELWGSDCCFRGLVETVFPHLNPAEFGL